MPKEISRRDFIKISGATLAVAVIGTGLQAGKPALAA